MSALGIRDICERLPHRYPILLVDRVEEIDAGKRLVAIKNVTFNEDFFRGHFPGNPIMPGVLIVEAMAQAAGLLVSDSLGDGEVRRPYLAGLEDVRFRRPVVPGDRLLLEAVVRRRRGPFWWFGACASVDGERATEARLVLSVAEAGR